MKRIKRIQANGFYIFRGEVVANGNFIETLEEAKKFLIYANYFLKDYLKVYEYVITRHEWYMVVKLKSSELICDQHNKDEGEANNEEFVWRIVSERVRLFLSNYVRCVNRIRGRTGTLVHSSYERYYFTSLSEAKSVIERIRLQTQRMYKRKRKYRGLKSHYKIPRRLGVGSIFLCSKDIKKQISTLCDYLGNLPKAFGIYELSDLVLSELIDFTLESHNLTRRTQNLPKLE